MRAGDPNRAMWEALQGLRAGKVVQKGPDLSYLSHDLKLLLESQKCELQIGLRMGKSMRTASQCCPPSPWKTPSSPFCTQCSP